MNHLAMIYLNGYKEIPSHPQKALKLLEIAIKTEKATPSSFNNLARIYHRGAKDIPKNPQKAVLLYQKGFFSKILFLLFLLFNSKSAIELGDNNAIYNLASIYHNGEEGVNKNIKLAIELYEKAIELNDSDAMNNLASIYKSGSEGVQKDIKKCVKLYERGKKKKI